MNFLMHRSSNVAQPLRHVLGLAVAALVTVAGAANAGPVGGAAHHVPAPGAGDRVWLLGKAPDAADNPVTPAKVELGKALFFDPRLSGNGTVSCASCHNPALGWSDGLKTGVGINGTVLGRATPTIINVAYNTQFMWDGRKKSLEDQALGPMKTPEEMRTDFSAALHLLGSIDGYIAMFNKAFPGEAIGEETMAKAIAAFERTVVSKDSRFDRWLSGWLTAQFGIAPQLWLSGTIVALVYAYLVRFMSISLQTVEAGLGKIMRSMEDAARSLGLRPAQAMMRVHAPLLARSLLTAGLLVFVDVMKELPATLAMRPFNFDTLAVQTYNLAKDERLAEASLAALAILAVGLIPVLLLARTMARR